MTKRERPAFQFDDVDLDRRVEARAAAKGIPTLMPTKAEEVPVATEKAVIEEPRAPSRAGGRQSKPTPRDRMRAVNLEMPEYVWIALKKRSAEEIVSVRYMIMSALRKDGIHIRDEDLVEDGRRRIPVAPR